MTFAIGQFARIIGQQSLQAGEDAGSLRPDLAHVGNIEEPGGLACGLVFEQKPGKLNGEIPAGKRNHAGAGGAVAGGQRGFRGGVGHGGGNIMTGPGESTVWRRRWGTGKPNPCQIRACDCWT